MPPSISPPAPAEPAPIVDESTDDYVFGRLANVVLYAWRRETTPRSLRVAQASLELAREAGGGKLFLAGVAEETAVVPGSELRAEISRLINRNAGALVASAFAFEGKGFRAAAIRSVGIGVSLLSRGAVPHRVFGTTTAGVEWAVEKMREAGAACPEPGQIVRAFAALRRAGNRTYPGF